MYFFRSLSILCAIAALILITLWIGDKITGMKFTQGWALLSSLLWMVIAWSIYRYLKKKHS